MMADEAFEVYELLYTSRTQPTRQRCEGCYVQNVDITGLLQERINEC